MKDGIHSNLRVEFPGIAEPYPELMAVVGSTVPDYRGRFLRHIGGNSAALGNWQEDSGRNVTGWFGFYTYNFATAISGGSTSTYNYSPPNYPRGFDGYVSGSGVGNYNVSRLVGIDASRQWGWNHAANEFRPTNVAVKWLIFAGI